MLIMKHIKNFIAKNFYTVKIITMGSIITVFSHKGGVGKTTLVHNLGYILADRGKRVLLIDADPQMNLTSAVAVRHPLGGNK